MPCSTMRRHLAHLVQAGVIVRRDSPNGKRYARRNGDDKVAFGFDLAPLVLRFTEFCKAAETIRAAEQRLKRLREAVSLMRRDLAALAEYGASVRPDLQVWDAFSDLAALGARALRRKLSEEDLREMEHEFRRALDKARDIVEPSKSEDMSINESIDEQHYQNSDKDSYESELSHEYGNSVADEVVLAGKREEGDVIDTSVVAPDAGSTSDENFPNIPLGLVLSTCTEIQTYSDSRIRHWHDLVRIADIVRPMMGISPFAWEEAKRAMGPEEASVVVSAMLHRFSEIRSPGGYLRHLSDKAIHSGFSSGPMVMALMRKAAA